MKKGLRRVSTDNVSCYPASLKTCPDEEGIKTDPSVGILLGGCPLKTCPDEEGIKTYPLFKLLISIFFENLP